MAVIEKYISRVSPDAARGLDTRVDTSVGRALANVGQSVSRAGAIAGQQQLFDIQEENRVQNFEALENEKLFQQRARQARQEALNNMEPDGRGHEESVNVALQQTGAEFGATLPPRLQEKFGERWARFMEGQTFLAGQEELDQSRKFAGQQAEDTADESLSGLIPTEQSYKEVLGNFNEWIDSDPRLSPIQREAYKEEFQRRLKLAYAALDDPENVRRQAGQQTGVSGSFIDRLINVESGGDPNAKAATSSATGLGQFIQSTWTQFIKERHPELLGDHQKLRRDPALSREAIEWYAGKNSAALEKAGLPVNDATLYLAHFAGPQGAIDVLRNPDKSASEILGADKVRANKFLSGMTGANVVAWAGRKIGEDTEFNPYEDLDFETRMKLVNASQTAIEERQKTFDLLTKQRVEQEYDRFRLGIETGDIRQDEEILSNEFFDDGQKATLLSNLRAAEKRRGDDQDTINAFNNGTLIIDPFDPDDRKRVNMLYETAIQGGADQQEAREYVTKNAGIAPPDAVNQIRAGLDSTNPQVYAEALQRAQKLNTLSDYAFSGAPGAESIQKQVDTFEHYSRYLPANAAAQKMLQMQDPQFKRTADQILKSEEKEILNRTGENNVRKALDVTGFFGIGEAAIGTTPMQRSAIVAEYRDIYENAIIDAQGDHDLATELTYKRFGKIYGVTDTDGVNRIMRLPPEKDPNTAQLSKMLGSTSWMSDQLVTDVAAYSGQDISRENIMLQADNVTESDRLNNRPWTYQVFYFDGERWQRAIDRFAFDPQRSAIEIGEQIEKQETSIVSDALEERSERELEREAGRQAHQDMMDAHPLTRAKEVERAIIQQRLRNLTGPRQQKEPREFPKEDFEGLPTTP